jgi:two-component system, chemotaxis family, sensor histidine kinase and response regulator PixL
MSLNPDIRDQAYQFFIEEAQELLQVLESGLLELREDHSTPKVHELMRAAHSIKGGAASVELSAIELLAHRLEDFFKALYSDSVEFDAELESLLLQGYDCLSHPLIEQIESGSYDEEAALLAAEPVFAALEIRLEAALKNADSYIPSSSDLGVDIVSSIFEVDVVQSLEHLQQVLNNFANYDLEAELQETLDMFAGFAELFNLPGFSNIIQTAQTALANNSDRILEIIQVTLADCTIAKDLVLKGDREQGGEVSSALMLLAQSTASEAFTSELEALNLDTQDNFWSTSTATDTFTDDIFGTIPEFEVVTNIEEAVESIENIFDSLPDLETVPTSLVLPTAKETSPQSKISQPAATKNTKSKETAAKLSVRVDLDRLERMNNLVGELTINRNSLSLQNEQIQENVSELGRKFARFRNVTQKLREISDLIVLEQRSHSLHNSSLSVSSQPYAAIHQDEATEFDSLEMDNYSGLYASIQNVLEEVVQLEESIDDVTIFAKQSDRTINSQRQMLDQMRDELMWVRMLPLDQILQRFPRLLRDLSTKYQKPVELKLTGTGVLVDKAVLEKLSDPLLHLLRNGFDHGIETPNIRTSQGKAANGTIEIHAYYQGNQTVIEVKDDGKGLDLEKIAQKGIEQGLISASEVENATKERLYDLIFEPGFSTASKVSELSGRGVGMNIVRSQIETLKGKIMVTSSPGEGSVFTLRLPLTLTIAKLLVCSLGTTSFAIPSDSIEEIIIPTEEQIKVSHQQKFLCLNGKLVPIYCLQEILHYNCPVPDVDATSTAFKTIAAPEDWFAPILLLRRGQKLFALEVASLVSEQELVIKPYGKAIAAPQYSYGCTILGDGSLIPAFDGAALISTILGEELIPFTCEVGFSPELADAVPELEMAEDSTTSTTQQLIDNTVANNKTVSTKTIMVVDDSTALRRTMALTLEKHGYRVIQKKDGKDALDGFRQNPDLDLIICDVEMPTMNGFEFLGMRRRDSKLSKIPTFMLTSRSGAKHRNLATQLGADGYFTKPYVEQEFIVEIKKILDQNNSDRHNKVSNFPQIKQKTILIIDDSSALRRTLALSLENKRYHVLQARDGVEGLELLRNNLQTNLVICDVEMPNMNGFEFLTARRQEPNLNRIPVVMLTSRCTDKHRSLANSLGANGYFTKPYIEDKFIEDLDGFIDKYINS